MDRDQIIRALPSDDQITEMAQTTPDVNGALLLAAHCHLSTEPMTTTHPTRIDCSADWGCSHV